MYNKSEIVREAMNLAVSNEPAMIDQKIVPNSMVRQFIFRFKHLHPNFYFKTKSVAGFTYVTALNVSEMDKKLKVSDIVKSQPIFLSKNEIDEIADGMRDLIRSVLKRRLDTGNRDDEELV